ncbi:thioester domain-containing protein [Actinokineospora sp. UTMC 2448]|uniref:thioester domain-containing protein n=1 Tax=Actinokineospora sp. UTMC 2448 TaxID=2268449 RepID=UPI0021641279|nr:thioester domain-containing protein [Actinokineospora sp. UTMC 2448]UVS76519.1 TQXA domain protein [Actinokineospora sp. UTMC 2448]
MGKLGRVGAAVAATALLMGFAALPAAAEAASGRLDNSEGKKIEGEGLNIKGSDKNPHQASLLHLDLNGGGHLKVYCVEFHVGATQQRDMIETPWDAYPNPGSPFHANRGKIKWILHHGFPAKSLQELNALDLEWGEAGLEQTEAISATQAAIWHFSDGVELDRDDASARDDAEQDILALYDYLIANAEDLGEQPTPVLEINPDAVEGKAGEAVGPFKVTTNGEIAEVLTDLPEGVVLTTKDGTEVTDAAQVADGAELFVKVPADAAPGEGGFALSTLSKVDIGRLFVVDGYHENGEGRGPAQSLIVAESEETELVAEAAVKWAEAPVTTTTPTTTTEPAPSTTTEAPAPSTTPAPPVPGDDLPDTGANILVPVLVGVGLLGAGAGALIWQRRRKTA